MLLNLTAILVFLLAVAGVLLLVGRRLQRAAATGDRPAAAAAGALACVACGAPAAELTTFACPSCGRDVRELGLADPRRGSGARPLWQALGLGLAAVLVGMLCAVLLSDRFSATYWLYEVDRQSTYDSTAGGYVVNVYGAATAIENETPRGDVVADLVTRGGGFAALEVSTPPLRGRIVDRLGNELTPEGPLDVDMALRWFEAAGADPEQPAVGYLARHVLVQLAQDLRQPSDVPMPTAGGLFASSTSSTSSGSSGFRRAPAWVAPASLIFWSVVWFAGVCLLVGRRRPAAEASRAPALAGGSAEENAPRGTPA